MNKKEIKHLVSLERNDHLDLQQGKLTLYIRKLLPLLMYRSLKDAIWLWLKVYTFFWSVPGS